MDLLRSSISLLDNRVVVPLFSPCSVTTLIKFQLSAGVKSAAPASTICASSAARRPVSAAPGAPTRTGTTEPTGSAFLQGWSRPDTVRSGHVGSRDSLVFSGDFGPRSELSCAFRRVPLVQGALRSRRRRLRRGPENCPQRQPSPQEPTYRMGPTPR